MLPAVRTAVVVGGTTFEPEARALFARFTVPPSSARRRIINNWFVAYKTAGLLAKCRVHYFRSAADVEASRLNWISDEFNITTAGGTPTFVPDRGMDYDGVDDYETTGFNPTTASLPLFVLDSAHMSVWHLTGNANGAGVSGDCGITSSRFQNSSTAGHTLFRPNNATNVDVTENYAKNKTWSRTASNAFRYYNTGALVASVGDPATTASTALTNAAFNLGQVGGFGVNRLAKFRAGSALTTAEEAAAHAADLAYMQAVGAA